MSSPTTTTAATRSAARSVPSPTSAFSSAWPAASTAWCTCPTSPGTLPAKRPCGSYQKGQTVEAVVVAIDPERERISLSVKQLAQDPFSNWIAQHPKGSIVRGIVREVEAKGAIVDLGGGIDGYLRASELARDRVEDARMLLKVGDEVEAKFTAVDRKVRTVALSIKAKDMAEEHEAMQSYRSDSTTGTSLGDLLKEQISGQED